MDEIVLVQITAVKEGEDFRLDLSAVELLYSNKIVAEAADKLHLLIKDFFDEANVGETE